MEPKAFNDNEAEANTSAVRGHFFASTTDAVTAAGVTTNSATVTSPLTSIDLHTADKYGTVEAPVSADTDVAANARTDSVYFAFSGQPDAGKGTDLNTFKKVGTITVSITPKTDMTDEYAPYAAN